MIAEWARKIDESLAPKIEEQGRSVKKEKAAWLRESIREWRGARSHDRDCFARGVQRWHRKRTNTLCRANGRLTKVRITLDSFIEETYIVSLVIICTYAVIVCRNL